MTNLFTHPNPEPLWTVEDVARYLSLDPVTVRKMVRDGRLPVVRLKPRLWRFQREAIADWLENMRRNPCAL